MTHITGDPMRRGRPRTFDADAALAAALRVFWARGYESASLTELTREMGISRPSLYSCFGNKEALFRKALDLYGREKLAHLERALAAPTSRKVAERLLADELEMQRTGDPEAWLDVTASIACAAESIRADVMASRAASDSALVARFARARQDGDLPSSVDPAALANLLIAVTQGLSVQARSGASHGEMMRLVEIFLLLWPRPEDPSPATHAGRRQRPADARPA
jgi:AcrR family transcriptional regulator